MCKKETEWIKNGLYTGSMIDIEVKGDIIIIRPNYVNDRRKKIDFPFIFNWKGKIGTLKSIDKLGILSVCKDEDYEILKFYPSKIYPPWDKIFSYSFFFTENGFDGTEACLYKACRRPSKCSHKRGGCQL